MTTTAVADVARASNGAIAIIVSSPALVDPVYYRTLADAATRNDTTGRPFNTTNADDPEARLWAWCAYLTEAIGSGHDRLAPRIHHEFYIWHAGTAEQLAEHLATTQSAIYIDADLRDGRAFLSLREIERRSS
jgi:hypothetical protein